VKSQHDIIISASRRTDIPAFYMEWFIKQTEKGRFDVKNPYNNKIRSIPANPCDVNTIVFWSKNFEPFIDGAYGTYLKEKGYNLFFNFTINSDSNLLEPNIPPLNERLSQLNRLSEIFGSECINLRFDPICFYKTNKESLLNNMKDFNKIITSAAEFGIKRCITSFMDHYPKIKKRVSAINGFSFIEPPTEKKIETLIEMGEKALKHNIELFLCCEKTLLDFLPKNLRINNSSCINNVLLAKLYGGNISFKKDYGQRVQKGCGCNVSVDIGSYAKHPCYNNCLFCYANPSDKIKTSGKL